MQIERRGRPPSLALRLITLISLAVTLIFLGLGWVIERSIQQHFAQQDAEELAAIARSVQQGLQAVPPGASRAQVAAQLPGAVQGHHGMYYMVADEQGQTLYATPGPDLQTARQTLPNMSELDADALAVWSEGDQTYRGAVLHLKGPGPVHAPYTAVVAISMVSHEHFLMHFHHTLWGATSVAVLLAILATWLAVHRGHAPLREVSARIRGISADLLHVRLEPQAVPIELAGLAESFNTMLERVEQDFRRLSNFSADIAHELRTPVTNLITQTQVVLTKARTLSEYQEVLYSNLEEYERMAKMIGDMLYLAQADNQLIKPDLTQVDVKSEVQALFDYFEPLAEDRNLTLTLSGQSRSVQGDRLMLRRALSNLLSNAIRHATPGQAVSVSLLEDETLEWMRVQVCNPGDAISPEHLPHLFDRFYRVDPSRQRQSEGAGLGLAIVKAIVEAHGGNIAVRSDKGQTCFEIGLPVHHLKEA